MVRLHRYMNLAGSMCLPQFGCLTTIQKHLWSSTNAENAFFLEVYRRSPGVSRVFPPFFPLFFFFHHRTPPPATPCVPLMSPLCSKKWTSPSRWSRWLSFGISTWWFAWCCFLVIFKTLVGFYLPGFLMIFGVRLGWCWFFVVVFLPVCQVLLFWWFFKPWAFLKHRLMIFSRFFKQIQVCLHLVCAVRFVLTRVFLAIFGVTLIQGVGITWRFLWFLECF